MHTAYFEFTEFKFRQISNTMEEMQDVCKTICLFVLFIELKLLKLWINLSLILETVFKQST